MRQVRIWVCELQLALNVASASGVSIVDRRLSNFVTGAAFDFVMLLYNAKRHEIRMRCLS